VVLPKLNLAQTLPLTQTLAAMGLPLTGDYSGLGAGDNQISQVVQKVVMKVDEAGTKAAAATGIGVTTLARVPSGKTVTFDRAFLLMLEDTATHTPLFLARVADPTSS
jgi:serine protease inhibitor